MGKDAPTVPRRRRGELLLINPNNQKTNPTQYAIVNSNAGYSRIPEPSHGRNTWITRPQATRLYEDYARVCTKRQQTCLSAYHLKLTNATYAFQFSHYQRNSLKDNFACICY